MVSDPEDPGKEEPRPETQGRDANHQAAGATIHVVSEFQLPPAVIDEYRSNERKKARRDWWIFGVQILTLVAVVIYTVITGLGLKHAIKSSEVAAKNTKSALDTTADHVKAAKQSADAATAAANAAIKSNELTGKGLGLTGESINLSRQQLVAVQRAFVFATGLPPEAIDSGDNLRTRLRVRVENSGNTPTKNFSMYTNFLWLPAALPDDFGFPDFDERGTHTKNPVATRSLIPPKYSLRSGNFLDVSVAMAQAINDKKLFLYSWGWIRYRDVFPGTMPHITRFCYRVAWLTTSTVAADHCDQNNCADEECDEAGSHR